jgi:hypothetical protein
MMNLKKMLGFILWFFFAMPSLIWVFFITFVFNLRGVFWADLGLFEAELGNEIGLNWWVYLR